MKKNLIGFTAFLSLFLAYTTLFQGAALAGDSGTGSCQELKNYHLIPKCAAIENPTFNRAGECIEKKTNEVDAEMNTSCDPCYTKSYGSIPGEDSCQAANVTSAYKCIKASETACKAEKRLLCEDVGFTGSCAGAGDGGHKGGDGGNTGGHSGIRPNTGTNIG